MSQQDDTPVSGVPVVQLTQHKQRKQPKFQLLSTAELSQLEPHEVLTGTHLVARGFNITFGPSGAYKSFFCLDMALRVSQSYPVVYVAAEGSSGLFQRVHAWSDYYQLPTKNVLFLCQELNLRDSASVQEFVDTIKSAGIRPALIVVDTLARCLVGGEENSSKDVGVAIYHSAQLQRIFNSALLWIHHSNRAETGERGSGAMRGAADSMIEMSLDENDLIKVKCSKVKDSESWPTEIYKFNKVSQSGVLLPVDDIEFKASQLSKAQVEILKFLNQKSLKDCGAKVAHIKESLNLHLGTVYKVLSSLEENFAVFHEKRGDPYFISPTGISMVSQLDAKKSNVVSIVRKEDIVC